MTKRALIVVGLSLLLGTLTSAVAFGVSPAVLEITGPVLCDAGTSFVVHEGPTVELPDNRRGAPVHFACVGAGEIVSEPRLGAAFLVLWLAATVAWSMALACLVRRLVAASQVSGERRARRG